MDGIIEQITEWLKDILIAGSMSSLSGVFDSVNNRVGTIAADVGTTPGNFSPEIFTLIRNISESVILPIAGMILTFIACWELIHMIIDLNNLANFETWNFFRWIFKTFVAVMLVSNTFDIVMAVFDVAQQVIVRSGNLITGSTAVGTEALQNMQATMESMDLGSLMGLYMLSSVFRITLEALAIVIFVIVYGRMIEIYCASRSAAFHPKAVRGHFGNPALASR